MPVGVRADTGLMDSSPLQARDNAAEHVALSEVVAALSHALDLTEGQPRGHAGRTCLLGMRLARAVSLSENDRSSLYYALLLKDAGCSSSAARMTEIFGGRDDLELKRAAKLVDFSRPAEALRFVKEHAATSDGALSRAREVIVAAIQFAKSGGEIVEARCDRGARIVASLGFPPDAAEAVRALDEHWDGNGRPRGLRGAEIPHLARIACIAQTVDVFLTAFGVQAAREMVRDRRGRWFDPELADPFLAIADGDPIWLELDEALDPTTVAHLDPGTMIRTASDEDLDRISAAFADVIDAKSPYTFNHSAGVADYAVAIGRVMGVPVREITKLRRAGLLHDIGKLGVSNSILDKPARLTDDEFAAVRLHPRFTEEILSRVSAFSQIAFAAGAHHERIDSGGYHRGLPGSRLPLAARILAVADVFEAMSADRPYRAGMPVEKILGIMRDDIGAAFCGEVVEALHIVLGRASAPVARELVAV
jgi:HD-GYP domain-containing protein (c-di-GMP phosphodiesterase class II)